MRILEFKQGNPRYPVLEHVKEGALAAAGMAPLIKQVAKEEGKTSINLWCRGTSGVFYASFVASNIMGMPTRICYIRKEGERSHGCDWPEPIHGNVLDVFVDDFADTGETLRKVTESMAKVMPKEKFDVLAFSQHLNDDWWNPIKDECDTIICNEDIR